MSGVATAILISGRGSNMRALVEAAKADGFPARIALVLSNRADAAGLDYAAAAGIATEVLDHKAFKDRHTFDEALHRVNTYYRPYHAALARLIERTRARFGYCLLIDCHSMPSVGGPADSDPGHRRVDIVLGDCHGASCDRRLTDLARRTLSQRGYIVRRNVPYAGAYTTRNYGAPQRGIHALQIEINRALYMDEASFRKSAGFAGLCEDLGILIDSLTRSPVAAAA